MRRNMKNRLLSVSMIVALVLAATSAVFAQVGPPPPPPPPPPPTAIPLDGGVFLLLVSGLVYGAKKLYGK